MNYWIFKCNPEKYDLFRRLLDPKPEITWLVTRYADEIKTGDTAFLWQTGNERGIYAVMSIDTSPQDMPELVSEQSYWTTPETQVRQRVTGRLTHRGFTLPSERLKAVGEPTNLAVFHGFQQGTNFPVTPEEGATLMNIINYQVG